VGRIFDWLFPSDPGSFERAEVVTGPIEDAIAAAIRDRAASFLLRDALALPPVARGIDLITTIGASFAPIEYTDGAASPIQPRFIRQPDPFRTRQDWLSMLLLELVTEAEAFLLLGEWLEGYPSHAIVLPHDEVGIGWDDRRFQPVYEWRGRTLVHGQDIWHVAINRRPGELHGRSVLRDALPYLATVAAAEEFAALSFGSGGVPTTVLRVANRMTQDEAKALKASWANSRADSALTGEPAVLSGGIEAVFPDRDPQSMQLQEARGYGATVVARLLGIPAPLLLAETSGASITYANVAAVVALLAKMTIVPKYLGPVEAALSAIVPRTKAVRFSLSELLRADVATRYSVYGQAITSGIMSAEEIRALEGMAPTPPTRQPAYDPAPNVVTDATIVAKSEVPVA
jgi:HK97 family phage portal protein